MPKINLPTPIPVGWHAARIEGVEFRDSTKDNPMLVLELTLLDLGSIVNGYLVVREYGPDHMPEILRACGFGEVAEQLRRKRNPAFELDDLIGKQLFVYVGKDGYPAAYSSKPGGYVGQRRRF